jgi:sulfur-oxidizing protein SoxA
MTIKKPLFILAMGFLAAAPVFAQKSTIESIEEYREMLQDGNPADLFEMKGAELWTQQRGPKNASLEKCDLGKGPGVVKGAFVALPRYFADTKKIQDTESRLLTCMETLQGISAAETAKTSFGKGEQKNTCHVGFCAVQGNEIQSSASPSRGKSFLRSGQKAVFSTWRDA